MKPYLAAWEAYHEEPPGSTWNEMLSAHLHNPQSWVVSSPSLFIAARRVWAGWDDDKLVDAGWWSETGDSIHVYVAAGRLADMLPLLPFRPEFLTFQRRGYRVHRLPASRLL